MKIGVISDLHIDRHKKLTPEDYTNELVNAIQNKE